jgi:hypothetical protein
MNEGQPASGTVRLSSPELPFALGILDDENAYLAASLNPDAKASQHRKVLEKVPSGVTIPNGYNPPWVRTALSEITGDTFACLLGEIPADMRKELTQALNLRACPRTFVLSAKRTNGGIAVSLSLNVDKAGAEVQLREDLEKWQRQGLQRLQAKLPAVKKEPQALALVGQFLNSMRWEAKPGSRSVHTQVQIPDPTWKAVRTLLKRAAEKR